MIKKYKTLNLETALKTLNLNSTLKRMFNDHI